MKSGRDSRRSLRHCLLLIRMPEHLQDFFLAGAADVELDKQGRILIPSVLREFASLQKDVVFVGVGSRIEIWSKESWNDSISNYDDNMDEVAENMDSLGFTI